MTSDGTYTYIYDGENRLKEVKQGVNTIAIYTYDYMGRRTSTTESGITTYYHYDGWNVVAETDSSGNTAATYTYDGSTSQFDCPELTVEGLTTGQPISMTRSGQTYYYQYNAHGDVVSLTNNLGQVVNTYTYDPWGKVLTANEQVSNPYRYAGYRYDAATGLYYLRARYYKPDIFRFLTRDTYRGEQRNPQSLNRYVYVENNPLNFIDPLGLWTLQIGFGGSAGAGGGVTAISGFVLGSSRPYGFQFGSFETQGAGGYGGLSASLTLLEVSWSKNKNVCELAGKTGTVQTSYAPLPLWSVTGEANIPMQKASPSFGVSINLGRGLTNLEEHGLYTKTWVQKWWGK